LIPGALLGLLLLPTPHGRAQSIAGSHPLTVMGPSSAAFEPHQKDFQGDVFGKRRYFYVTELLFNQKVNIPPVN